MFFIVCSIKWFHGQSEIFSYIFTRTGESHYTFGPGQRPGINITVSKLM